jgi:hypothetical protein
MTMSKQSAIKLHVEVGPDHTIKLPDEVPVGPAELIVIIEERSEAPDPAGLIGLMADEPDVMDDVMKHIRERRERWGRRPVE